MSHSEPAAAVRRDYGLKIIRLACHFHVFERMRRVLRPLPARERLLWEISKPAFWFPVYASEVGIKPRVRWQ